MSQHWLERAKEGLAIGCTLLLLGALFFGTWGFIALELSSLGPWGIASAGTLLILQAVLCFRKPEAAVKLFFGALCGASLWYCWRDGDWGLGLALIAIGCMAVVMYSLTCCCMFPSPLSFDWGLSVRYLLEDHPISPPGKLLDVLASGEFPNTVARRTVNTDDVLEGGPVDCTVFAHDRMERKQSGLLLVFLHSPERRQQAEERAHKFDRQTKERGHRSLVMEAPIGTVFAFDVEIDGFVLKYRTDSLLWTGEPQAAAFPFEVPRRCKLGSHIGTVWISKDMAPVGRISFQIEVVRDAAGARERPLGEEARHYRACFCSYSNLDRAEMLKRAQGLRAAGLETFIDVMDLRPGDEWNPKIFSAIDESDLFVVIWSKNARASKWVRRESSYALQRYKNTRSPDFRPIPIEGPPIAPVPWRMRAYHFNDELLSLIRAAEVEAEKRRQDEG